MRIQRLEINKAICGILFLSMLYVPVASEASSNPGRESAWILENSSGPIVTLSAGRLSQDELRQACASASVSAGGDDVVVDDSNHEEESEDEVKIDIASNGDIYLAHGYADHGGSFPNETFLNVYKSTNGGTTFSFIGNLQDPAEGVEKLYSIKVVEGTVDRLFVTYRYWDFSTFDFEMRVAYEDLPVSTATWTVRTVMGTPGTLFTDPDLADDSLAFAGYYLYAVSADGNQGGIWYSRSTDLGNSWSTPYLIDELISPPVGIAYARPRIALGQGGTVHVAFTHTGSTSSGLDYGVRYIRAANFGSSATDWEPPVALYSNTDGEDQSSMAIVASPSSSTVAIITSEPFAATESNILASYTNGNTWSLSNEFSLDFTNLVDAKYDQTNDRVVMGGENSLTSPGEITIQTTPMGNVGNLSMPMTFTDAISILRPPGVALDPSRGNEIAVAWNDGSANFQNWTIKFDAEWRAEDGYPNYQPGFPISTLGDSVLQRDRTAPAIADLDGNSLDEIIFANTDGTVHVINSDGSVRAGWPVAVEEIALHASVSVGDLTGDGSLEVVVGTTKGKVHAFNPEGILLSGFPVDLGTNADTYVSMGIVGGPYLRWIFAASGDKMARINYRGDVNFKPDNLVGTYLGPAAIGDVDNDGLSDVVVGYEASSGDAGVHIYSGDFSGLTMNRDLVGETLSAPVSLADINLDGDLEIAAPTKSGRVYLLQSDMTDYPNFPFYNSGAGKITPVHFSQILGNSQPELLFASNSGKVHVVYESGVEQTGFPGFTNASWELRSAPIPTGLQGHANWLTIGSRDESIYTFRNVGATPADGWPKDLGDKFEVSPARSDIDNDGRMEIVYLGNEQLHVIDVGPQPPFDNHSWTMAGNNAERNSCYNCAYDTATPAPTDLETRVSFRMETANPVRGVASFAANLPGPGVLELAVYDVLGRRVRLVSRESMVAGRHDLTFDGLGKNGVRLARGQYFARLWAEGQGFSEVLVRPFILVD